MSPQHQNSNHIIGTSSHAQIECWFWLQTHSVSAAAQSLFMSVVFGNKGVKQAYILDYDQLRITQTADI